MEETHLVICQAAPEIQEEGRVVVKFEVKLKEDNQFTEFWSFMGLMFLCFEALLVFMLEACLQWLRARRNHQNAGRFRFLWVLNYVRIVRHIHHYVNALDREIDVPNAEDENVREQQDHNPVLVVEEEQMEGGVDLGLQQE